MDLFNVTTRRKESIDDSQALQQAILSGSHAFSQGTKVVVKSPDGQMGTIPSENVVDAIKAGYQVETNSQRAVREYVDDNQGILGSLKVGLGQFADEALLGLPELIYNKTQDPLEVAKKNALKKEHSFANALGGIAGFGSSLFLGAPLWKAGSKAGEKVASHIAQKIAVETGEQATKSSIRKAAANIAGKIGGSATEGAIVTAPQVITEAALGDPMAAGETLLAGVSIGALFGAGTGLGKEFLGLGKKVSDETARALGEQDITLKKIARRIAKSVTNVDEDDILYYIKNRDKVNAAPGIEQLKNQIDDAYKSFSDDAFIKTEALKNTEEKLNTAYKSIQRDMSQARAPQALADDIVLALENEKAVLGKMSDEAEQILADSAAFLPKKKVIQMINRVKRSVVPFEVGEKAKAAAKKLDTLANDISEQFPANIDGNELRTILRQVRDDIDYNQLAGQFNDRSNRALKNFTEIVSEELKDQSKEYAKQMKLMYDRSKALERMSKGFKDRETAANVLTRMQKPGSDVKRELLKEFSDITGEDFYNRFDELVKVQDQLEAIKRGTDLRPQLLPNLFKEKQELEIAARNANELLTSLKKINPNSSQQAIRNMNRKDANIQTRRAFERLEELTGTPFLELIRDRNILDNFSKQSTQGSRKVNLFATLMGGGAATLGADLGAAGALAAGGAIAGATLDSYGGKILQNILDRPNLAGLLFVEKAMKKTADEIDRIPSILERMSKGQKEIKKSTIGIEALFRLQDPEAKPAPESKASASEQLEKVGEQIRSWLADPVKFQNMIEKFTVPLAEGGAPKISEGLTIAAQKALSYLQTEIPKPPNPSSPFAPKIAWNPSDFELNRFVEILEVAQNPMIVLDELEAGTLTANHMESLKNLYPTVFQAIQNKVLETATQKPESMSYSDRVKLSLLVDLPLDQTLNDEHLLSLQRKFMTGDQQQQDLSEEDTFTPSQNVDIAKSNLTQYQSAIMQRS